MMRPLRNGALVGGALLVLIAGCGQKPAETGPEAVEVTAVAATSGTIQLTDDLPGRVVAFRTAEIRPQVGGIVQRKQFTEGAVVRAGQPLFQINAAPFRADAESASAALQRARAVRDRSRVQLDRLKPLLAADAVSRQTYDDAEATLVQAEADVAGAQAALNRRRLDVGFATIVAPIGGRIGASAITEGALVGVSDTNALATIQQIGQVYVDVRQPAARLEQLRGAGQSRAPVEILDADGKPTGLTGRLLFSEASVDPTTGDLTVRVLVDNASNRLLPGMFVRARLPRGAEQVGVRVPQQAVVRQAGQAIVMVVSADGRSAVARPVQVGEVVDGHYVVLSGLRAGERVVVEGQDRIVPGQPIHTRAWQATPASAPAT